MYMNNEERLAVIGVIFYMVMCGFLIGFAVRTYVESSEIQKTTVTNTVTIVREEIVPAGSLEDIMLGE